MAEHSSNIYSKFKTMNLRARLLQSAGGLYLLIAVAAALAAVAVLISTMFELSPAVKFTYLGLLAMAVLAALVYMVIYPHLKGINYSMLARRVEVFHPGLKDYLSAAVELKRNLKENPEGYSTEFINSVIISSSEKCKSIDFNKCIDKKPGIERAKYASLILAVSVLIFVIYPSGLLYALKDFTNPGVKFEKPDPYALEAVPGDVEMLKGDDIIIGAVIRDAVKGGNGFSNPENAEIFWRYEQSEKYHSAPMNLTDEAESVDSIPGEALFYTKLKKVNRSFEYYVSTDKVKSRLYKAEVINKPRIIDLKQRLYYPKYTGLPPAIIDENNGNIIALAGTKARLILRSSKPIESGKAVFTGGRELPLEIGGDTATFSFTVKSDDSYHIEITDTEGLHNPEPIKYSVYITADSYPEVSIIRPGEDLVVPEADNLPIVVRAKDDFGFSSLKLTYEAKSSGIQYEPVESDIPFESDGEGTLAVGFNWDLSGLGLIPGDEVTYYVTVADNDRYSGFKTAESKRYSVRLPSLDQILAEFDERQDRNVIDLEEIVRQQQKQKEEIMELRREMMRLKKTDWEKSKRLEEAIQKQEQIADAMDKLQENVNKNIDSAEENKMNTLEILEKSKRIEELINEINSPELQKVIEELREAMQKLDPRQINKALENFQFSQEEYLEKLERTLDMLKRLRAEQKFDQLKELADKMAEQQEDISEELENADENTDMDKLSDRQEQVKKELESFNEGLEKMKEYNEETPVLDPEDLKELMEMAKNSGLKEEMEEASEEMQEQNMSACQKNSRSASNKLKGMQMKMQQMQQQMRSKNQMEILRIVRKAFNDVVYLSQSQEGLMDTLDMIAPRDTTIRFLSSPQQRLSQKTLKVREDLEELYELDARTDPSLSTDLATAAGNMNQAIDKLESKSKFAVKEQTDALKYLNRVGFKLLMMAQQQQGGSSSSSGSNCQSGSSGTSLSELTQQQQSLNQNMQGLPQMMRRGVSNSDMLSRMAAEQEAIRQGLRELLQEGGGQSPGQMGRLEDLGEEMKKVVDDFERNAVNRNTLQRQEKILSRLLEAQKSLRTQGFKKERKAETGEDITRSGPAELADTRSKIHGQLKRLQSAMNENYPMEYRNMIKAYIEAQTSKISTAE
ncbi:MAG: hypothetical protein GF307_00355 [candidate division Zixibacteria bacterium]|nr:hypothetical protein [candidate division Zixibacteria bacterium]